MVHPSIIEARLGELGFRNSRWFNAEIRELEQVLMEGELIISIAMGRYFGSFALLVATDQRLLLIDKRVFFVTIQDTRYDMISEIDYNSHYYSATVTVFTMNKTHKFTSVKNKQQLRDLTSYVQRRVWEFRQQQQMSQGPEMAQPPRMRIESQMVPQPQPAVQQIDTGSNLEDTLEPLTAPAPAAPRPMSARPTDYYVDDKPADYHTLKGHVGHVAHLVGSAAMHATHPHSTHAPVFRAKMYSPYSQGSIMTRRPIASPGTNYR